MCAYGLIFLAAIYTMFSGFYGVVYTDLFQGGIILVAVVYVTAKAFMAVTGSAEVAEVALQVTNNPDWLSSVPKWTANMPKGYESYKPLVPLMLFYLFRNIFQGFGNIGDPKFFGTKTDRECGKLTALWTMMMTFRWPMMMGIAVLGLFLVRDLFPDMSVLTQAGELIHGHFPDLTQQDWGSMIGLRVASEQNDSFARIVLSNGGLPTGIEKPPLSFLFWKFFVRFSPFLPIGEIVNYGSTRKLSKNERRAYLAPFPSAEFKTGPRILPRRLPLSQKNPDAELNRRAWKILSNWEKPFLTVFSDSDPITRGLEKKFQKVVPGARNQNHTILHAGHFIQEDAGLDLAEIIISFIQDNIRTNQNLPLS